MQRSCQAEICLWCWASVVPKPKVSDGCYTNVVLGAHYAHILSVVIMIDCTSSCFTAAIRTGECCKISVVGDSTSHTTSAAAWPFFVSCVYMMQRITMMLSTISALIRYHAVNLAQKVEANGGIIDSWGFCTSVALHSACCACSNMSAWSVDVSMAQCVTYKSTRQRLKNGFNLT